MLCSWDPWRSWVSSKTLQISWYELKVAPTEWCSEGRNRDIEEGEWIWGAGRKTRIAIREKYSVAVNCIEHAGSGLVAPRDQRRWGSGVVCNTEAKAGNYEPEISRGRKFEWRAQENTKKCRLETLRRWPFVSPVGDVPIMWRQKVVVEICRWCRQMGLLSRRGAGCHSFPVHSQHICRFAFSREGNLNNFLCFRRYWRGSIVRDQWAVVAAVQEFSLAGFRQLTKSRQNKLKEGQLITRQFGNWFMSSWVNTHSMRVGSEDQKKWKTSGCALVWTSDSTAYLQQPHSVRATGMWRVVKLFQHWS